MIQIVNRIAGTVQPTVIEPHLGLPQPLAPSSPPAQLLKQSNPIFVGNLGQLLQDKWEFHIFLSYGSGVWPNQAEPHERDVLLEPNC